MNLVTAQIMFRETHLGLVHIPNEYYHFFASALLRMIFGNDYDGDIDGVAWPDRHDFLNLSISPVGCSLVASKFLIDKYLQAQVQQFSDLLTQASHPSPSVEISHDDYVAIQVDGQGLDAGQRVLELTGPLAMAGISLFFISTYFSDYILVPVHARHAVLATLQHRGFVFSTEVEAYVSQLSPAVHHNHEPHPPFHHRPRTGSAGGSDGHGPHSGSAPMTPPAKDMSELETRTFTKLAKHEIEPIVNRSLRLVSCAGSRDVDLEANRLLKEDLIQVLLAGPRNSVVPPTAKASNGDHLTKTVQDYTTSFLSITLSSEPVSVLMEERLLPQLGQSLLGSKGDEDILVPIVFDLQSLGWTATGIVGGVAGRLSQGPISREVEEEAATQEALEISFLSSAKAGSVIVQARHLDRALQALEMGKQETSTRR